jgi:hypothetical protein
MQAGDQGGDGVQRVRDPAAMAAGMQVLGGAGHGELQCGEAAIGDGDGGFVRPPHRAVGRQHEIGAQLLGIRRDERAEMRAAALFLAFDHQF